MGTDRPGSGNGLTILEVVEAMRSQHDLASRIDRLRQAYAEIGGPAPDQWESLLSLPVERPVTLVNLFAFHDIADYGDSAKAPETGQDAFNKYAAVSSPTLAGVGGRFIHFGSHHGTLVGDDKQWDLIVVGEYPNVDALLALHEDPAYQDAYRHRVAACARQRVLISA